MGIPKLQNKINNQNTRSMESNNPSGSRNLAIMLLINLCSNSN